MTSLKNSSYFKLSAKLISLDTVSFKPNGECAAIVANELKELGFKTFIEKHQDCHGLKEQVIAWIGPQVEEGIILSGHLDTVPFANQPGWSKDALSLTLENDKLYGRGSCDMKLFTAQCIETFSQMDLTKLTKPIVCIFTSDEEVGCLGAKRLLNKLETILDKMPLPKRALIGEPTSFEVINTHKGIVHFDIEIFGKAGHSSRPDLGINSIEPLGKIIELINHMNFEFKNSLDPELKKLFPDFPYNFLHMATVDGGLALNMIPEKTTLQVSYRCFPSESPTKLVEAFKKKLQGLNLGERVKVSNISTTPSMPLANSPELERLLMEVCQQDKAKSVSFATDGGYLAKLGIECFICGPGEIKMAHQPDEYMPLKDFIEGPTKLKSILESLLY